MALPRCAAFRLVPRNYPTGLAHADGADRTRDAFATERVGGSPNGIRLG